MATIAVTRRYDLTDVQWTVLAPLLPAGKRPGRPSQWRKRQLIDGIRWRVRVGAPWRDVPACYGSWQAVYALFRRWQRAGVWQQIVTGLQARVDAAGLIRWDVSLDSTIARAHQHAAGARRRPHQQVEPPGGVATEPSDHAFGRSRGGWTTTLHLVCEQGGKPLSMLLTAGHRGDSPQFAAVLAGIRVPRLGAGRPRTRPDRVIADRAYTSRANRSHLRRRGIKACIPSKADQDANRRAKGSAGGRPPRLRPQGLPAASRRGVRHQPPQTPPGLGHQVRQAGRPLRSHHPRHRHQRVATRTSRHDLGQLYGTEDAWQGGWGPPIEELKNTVRACCAAQLRATQP